MLLGTAASILGNSLAGKRVIKAGEGVTNFEIQKYYQNEPKFNGVYSRNYISEIKDGAYIINLDESESIVTQWIALYVNVT